MGSFLAPETDMIFGDGFGASLVVVFCFGPWPRSAVVVVLFAWDERGICISSSRRLLGVCFVSMLPP